MPVISILTLVLLILLSLHRRQTPKLPLIFKVALLKLINFLISIVVCPGSCSADNVDFLEGLSETYNRCSQHGYNSSSDSNSSSISSLSSSSSDSDYKMNTGASELEADADSLTCRQAGLSSNNQLENDFPRLVFHLSNSRSNFCYRQDHLMAYCEVLLISSRVK